MNLEISVEFNAWNKKEIKSIVNECAYAVFSEIKLNDNNVEICFLFTDNDEIRTLNKTYRGINKPTNVLAFPANLPTGKNDEYHIRILGSIALAFETIEQESINQGKSIQNHMKHLIVHGLLHLLGYNHLETRETEQMEALEMKILKKLNVENPYK
ncbi:MAG: rRNA maturation RNase YbeY [Holosporaceae bacterium]|jgi:probable rRNA maturation factor|nr:rRNA maturation RNase YbeY [Holosporaceae bacterium]